MDERFNSEDNSANEKVHQNCKIGQNIIAYELKNFFKEEEIRAEVTFWKRVKHCLGDPSVWINKQSSFNRICGLCLVNPKEPKMLVKFRRVGRHRLQTFLESSTRKDVQSKNIKLLMWSCLSLMTFYYHKRQERHCSCFRKEKFLQCQSLYLTALYMVLPEQQDEVIKHTIRYTTLSCQWNTEEYDSFIFQEMFFVVTKPEVLVAKIIKQIETSQREDALREAYNISYTLSNILEQARWDKYLFNYLLHNCFNTLLKIYLLCNSPVPSNVKYDNAKLRIIIRTCIKYFVNNIKDNKGLVSVMDSLAKCLLDSTIGIEDRREIIEMLVFSAQKHQTKFYRESITPDCLFLLLENLTSNDKIMAMSSIKILVCLMDRRGNERNFTEPVYFFKGRSSFIVNFDLSIEDTHFFKSFSKKFLEGILNCFLRFTDKHCLIPCYVLLCIVLVEIPEPVITINIIHLLITIQNETLRYNDTTLTVNAHIQSIIASLMSLVCVIHEDKVNPLKKYVEEVVRFRTENSPHLLPPLQNKYVWASHHTVDYHVELYFQENEILYALQRCWLGRKIPMSS